MEQGHAAVVYRKSMIAAFFSLAVVAAMVAGVWHCWREVNESAEAAVLKGFGFWIVKGLAVPAVVWMCLGSGLLSGMPVMLLPGQVGSVWGAGGGPPWVGIMGLSLLVIGSHWAAVTIGWMVGMIAGRTSQRGDFIGIALVWCVLLAPAAGIILYYTGYPGLGFAMLAVLVPILHGSLPFAREARPYASYAKAIAKLRFGKYREAEWEVIQVLEKCETDFDGWMMLADLYANHFNDLPEADRTIRELCNEPNTTGVQISIALQRLADWYLRLGNDPVSARIALDEVCLRLPGSHLAKMAQMRLEQLPATRAELLEQRQTKPIRLPPLQEDFDESAAVHPPSITRDQAAGQANLLVEKLRQNPNDVGVREQLARLFAEQLNQPDLAVEQMELLVGMPDQPPAKVVGWLAQIAAWHIQRRHDWPAGRARLEQLIREHPQSPQAFAAQRRINLMEMELRSRAALRPR